MVAPEQCFQINPLNPTIRRCLFLPGTAALGIRARLPEWPCSPPSPPSRSSAGHGAAEERGDQACALQEIACVLCAKRKLRARGCHMHQLCLTQTGAVHDRAAPLSVDWGPYLTGFPLDRGAVFFPLPLELHMWLPAAEQSLGILMRCICLWKGCAGLWHGFISARRAVTRRSGLRCV